MFKVIRTFADARDHEYEYAVGDKFPRDGVSVSEERVLELSSSNNKFGVPFIEAVSEALPVAEETLEEPNSTETPSEREKPKKRARKSKEENA